MALTLMLTSCSGQVKNDTTADRSSIVSPTPSEEGATAYKDPLFFIEGQLCQHLRKIFHDSKGQLWLGTNVYDLMLYNGDSLVYIKEEAGFSGGRVTGILEDKKGNIWLATGQGLNKYDGNTFLVYDEKDGLANAEIWSMMQDEEGIIWLGHNKGLSKFDGTSFENIPIPKPTVENPNTIYSADRITGIAKDKSGNLWLGTDGYGICTVEEGSFTHYTTKEGLADNAISELMIDSQNRLWIGTYWGGLSVYEKGKFINYTKDNKIEGVEISSLYEDHDGTVWVAVENNGVYRYQANTFDHYYKKAGLDGSILSMLRDREGRFWLGGWGGLFRYDGNSFMPVTKDGPWE